VIDSEFEAMRVELKAVLPAEVLRAIIMSTGWIYSAYPSRQVNSVYFDDSNYTSLRENLDGLNIRAKFRVRWYGNPDLFATSTSPSFEVKKKIGRSCRKDVYPFNQAKLDWRSDRFFEKLSLLWPQLGASTLALSPVIFVTYHRKYMVGPRGIRFTIDENIEFLPLDSGLSLSHPGVQHQMSVLECKCPLEDELVARELIAKMGVRLSRHSKYVKGMALLGLGSYI
jgi:SPX domain protein involved in polyphosphate accumulation